MLDRAGIRYERTGEGTTPLVSLMGSHSSIAALLTTFEVQRAPGQKPLLPPR
jgi:hypothetical protein